MVWDQVGLVPIDERLRRAVEPAVKRGDLVGAIIVDDTDEVLVVLESGKVVRSDVSEVPAKGRDTMGVVFARFEESDSIIGLARNTERNLETNESSDNQGGEESDAAEVAPQEEA